MDYRDKRDRSQLFVGRLHKDIRNRDLEDIFSRYGRMLRCDIKYGAAMAYAFVDYDDKRDAEDAIKYENGREMRGHTIVVEWAKGPNYRFRPGGGSYRSSGGGGGGYYRDGYRDRDSYRSKRRSRSRSRSRTPKRRRSKSRSRSRSRSRDRKRESRSESRSPSRSASPRSRSASRSKEDMVNGN